MDFSWHAERQSPQKVQVIPGFFCLIFFKFRASYLQWLVHFMHKVQFVSIYMRKGFAYLNTETRVPTGQYRVQCTILPFLLDMRIMTRIPPSPDPAAVMVAKITGTSSHRRASVTAIVIIKNVDLIAALFLSPPLFDLLPEARLSNAPK